MAYVAWVLEANVKEGELARLRSLMEEMVASTQADEPGATNYEWSLDEAGTTLHTYERYEDSAAALNHLAAFNATFASRFMACLDPVRMTVYGDPNEAAREALSGLGAAFMTPIGGFTR